MNNYSYNYSYQASSQSHLSPVAGLVVVVLCLAFYFYFSYSLYVMAKKTGVSDPWMAWVPIFLNLYILIKTAGKPGWWLILFFVPLLNIIMAFVVWYNAAKRLNKPGWYGILTGIIPLFIGSLAAPYKASSANSPAAMPPAGM